MSFAEALLAGFAQLLHANSVGTWLGALAPDDNVVTYPPLITLINMPQQPTQVICLTDYDVTADSRLSDAVIGLQVRMRGDKDPRTVMTTSGLVYDTLQGRSNLVLGGIPVPLVLWQFSAPLGPDDLGRYERTLNFYVNVNRVATYLEA